MERCTLLHPLSGPELVVVSDAPVERNTYLPGEMVSEYQESSPVKLFGISGVETPGPSLDSPGS
jgi:hypothetical protein